MHMVSTRRSYIVDLRVQTSVIDQWASDTLLAENDFPGIQSRYDCLGIPCICRTDVLVLLTPDSDSITKHLPGDYQFSMYGILRRHTVVRAAL